MSDEEWQPLPPDERKNAEKRLKQDKILLDRGFKKGQFTREYCVEKVHELEVKYGLRPPTLSEEEIAEMDADLDAALQERKKQLEKSDWRDLTAEERADAETKLLKEKKALNRAFKLGKLTREQCMERAERLEVELGLIQPPEEFEDVVTEADVEEAVPEDVPVPPEDWVPLEGEELEIAQNLLAMDKKLLKKSYKKGELTRELVNTKLFELKKRYKLLPPDAPFEEDPDYATEAPPMPVMEQPAETIAEQPAEPVVEQLAEPEVEPPEPEEAAEEPPQEEWDSGKVGGPSSAVERMFEQMTVTPGEEELDEELDELAQELEEVTPAYQEPEETIEDLDLEEPVEEEPTEVVVEKPLAGYDVEPEEQAVEEPVEEPEETVEDVAEIADVEEVAEDVAESSEEPVEEVEIPDDEDELELESEFEEEPPAEEDAGTISEEDLKAERLRTLTAIPGVGEKKAEVLYDAGFRTIHDVYEAGVEELSEVPGIGRKSAQAILAALMEMLEKGEIVTETTEVVEVTEEVIEPVVEAVEEPLEVPEPPPTEAEIEDLASEDEIEELKKEAKIGKGLLIFGIILCLISVISVFGLRMGLVQEYIFGDPNAYPGVGYVEPSGHMVSLIPFVIGLVTIMYWGFKNDPIYYEIQRLEEELDEEAEEEVYLAPSEVVAPAEEIQEEIEAFGEAIVVEQAELQKIKAEEERVARCEKMLEAAFIMMEDRDRLYGLISTGISAKAFTEEVRKAVEKRKTHKFSADEKAEVLADDLMNELEELDEIIESDAREEESEDVDVDDIIKEIEDLEDF